jgi:hypothetical protein
MQMSTYQRGTLERLRKAHQMGGPSWPVQIGFYRNQWLFSALWTAGMSWLLPIGWPVFVSLSLGAFAKDIAHIRSLRSQWPVMTGVIDWQRVDQLLAASSPAN